MTPKNLLLLLRLAKDNMGLNMRGIKRPVSQRRIAVRLKFGTPVHQ